MAACEPGCGEGMVPDGVRGWEGCGQGMMPDGVRGWEGVLYSLAWCAVACRQVLMGRSAPWQQWGSCLVHLALIFQSNQGARGPNLHLSVCCPGARPMCIIHERMHGGAGFGLQVHLHRSSLLLDRTVASSLCIGLAACTVQLHASSCNVKNVAACRARGMWVAI